MIMKIVLHTGDSRCRKSCPSLSWLLMVLLLLGSEGVVVFHCCPKPWIRIARHNQVKWEFIKWRRILNINFNGEQPIYREKKISHNTHESLSAALDKVTNFDNVRSLKLIRE